MGQFGEAEDQCGVLGGRYAGSEARSVGDVHQYTQSGKRIALPSTRGVRSLAVVTLGGRGSPRHRVCYGDGWHTKRQQALGRVTCALVGDDGFERGSCERF